MVTCGWFGSGGGVEIEEAEEALPGEFAVAWALFCATLRASHRPNFDEVASAAAGDCPIATKGTAPPPCAVWGRGDGFVLFAIVRFIHLSNFELPAVGEVWTAPPGEVFIVAEGESWCSHSPLLEKTLLSQDFAASWCESKHAGSQPHAVRLLE
mmetsp:Transcript_42587/g.87024  ORF Transcript_42587/g.87024 Transcript_42587/m.87024 type:complete len:154 (+) Transcript_42587:317-778(+)